ncbi:MAG: PhoH family protein [Clostridiales bacterium]|nr:PhoH family protein [Clostridiales bacterium]
MDAVTIKYQIDNFEEIKALFGNADENIKYLSEYFGVTFFFGDGALNIYGESRNAENAAAVLDAFVGLLRNGVGIKRNDLKILTDLFEDGRLDETEPLFDVVAVTAKGKNIRCKTPGQKLYVRSIIDNDLTFGIGPAGTGKTYLAVALAVRAYKNRQTERIILTRPAVEAGEKLGFLPGDLQEKVDPYLRPLYDALQEMFGLEAYRKLIERGVIEVAPLAYMRGRTLSNSFIILDEAQNATREQMKMFLTRSGERSKVVVTGDVTQTDLPSEKSGLVNAVEILKGVDKIGVVYLGQRDVVRNGLVREIIAAYERSSAGK